MGQAARGEAKEYQSSCEALRKTCEHMRMTEAMLDQLITNSPQAIGEVCGT